MTDHPLDSRQAARHPLFLPLALALCVLPCTARAEWAAEATVERFHWRERTAPIQVRENGPRFALGAAYLQSRAAGALLAYRGRVYFGNVTYDGSFQSNPSQPARAATTYLGTAQAGELRFRWPNLDGVAGLEYEVWRRELSASQNESFRLVSARLGAERVATPASPLVAGAGMRLLLAAGETATTSSGGNSQRVSLKPGLGSSPFLHLGYRVAPRLTLVAYYDGLHLGQSNTVAVGRSSVYQPESDMSLLGLKVVYGGAGAP